MTLRIPQLLSVRKRYATFQPTLLQVQCFGDIELEGVKHWTGAGEGEGEGEGEGAGGGGGGKTKGT